MSVAGFGISSVEAMGTYARMLKTLNFLIKHIIVGKYY
jgi:hypothetical protein